MTPPTKRKAASISLFAAVVACALSSERVAKAEDFSVTNLQLLYGFDMEDTGYGTATESGRLLTATLEHFGTYALGDNYVVLDVYHGEFVGQDGASADEDVRLYVEWTSRLRLSKFIGQEGVGPFRDIYAAVQLGRADGFSANLLGGGFTLDLPENVLLGFSAYLRDDNFNQPTYHLTPYWDIGFSLGRARFVFNGYFDIAGNDTVGPDIGSQPQLLFAVGSIWPDLDETLHIGIEWAYHRNDQLVDHAPQAMVRWTW